MEAANGRHKDAYTATTIVTIWVFTLGWICSTPGSRFIGVIIGVITGRAVGFAKATGRGHIEPDEQSLDEVIDGTTRGTGEVEVRVQIKRVIVRSFIVFYMDI